METAVKLRMETLIVVGQPNPRIESSFLVQVRKEGSDRANFSIDSDGLWCDFFVRSPSQNEIDSFSNSFHFSLQEKNKILFGGCYFPNSMLFEFLYSATATENYDVSFFEDLSESNPRYQSINMSMIDVDSGNVVAVRKVGLGSEATNYILENLVAQYESGFLEEVEISRVKELYLKQYESPLDSIFSSEIIVKVPAVASSRPTPSP